METKKEHGKLPYARVWFGETIEDGTRDISVFYFAVAGLHELYEQGLRFVRFVLTTASGDKHDNMLREISEFQDVFGGPIALSTDWGTLDVVGYWNETDRMPVQLARLFLNVPQAQS